MPDLQSLGVQRAENYDEPEDVRVVIVAWQEGNFDPAEETFFLWKCWV